MECYDDNREIITRIETFYAAEKSLSEHLSHEEIRSIAQNCDSEVRGLLAKALVHDNDHTISVECLLFLAEDNDDYVRIEAVDSLSAHPCQKSFNQFINSLSDPNELVRAYAALGLAIVGKTCAVDGTIKQLQIALNKENNPFTLAGIYEGLYILGLGDALHKLLDLFHADDYRIQCFVLHSLCEVINSQNKAIIQRFISTLNLDSYSLAVIDTLHQLNNLIFMIN